MLCMSLEAATHPCNAHAGFFPLISLSFDSSGSVGVHKQGLKRPISQHTFFDSSKRGEACQGAVSVEEHGTIPEP